MTKPALRAVEPNEQAETPEFDPARATLTGDVRDYLLAYMRDSKESLPWHLLPEAKQAEHISRATMLAENTVRRVVAIVAADGKRTIPATVEQVVVKEGLKAVVKAHKNEQNLKDLGMAEGLSVLIVVADATPYTGERQPMKPTPDERPLFDETDAGKSVDGETGEVK